MKLNSKEFNHLYGLNFSKFKKLLGWQLLNLKVLMKLKTLFFELEIN